jgi:alpha-1,2-mannosyltransferase
MIAGRLSPNLCERRLAHKRALEQLLLGGVPLVLTLWLVVSSVSGHWIAQDFSEAYYPAAHRLLDGGNPYAVTHSEVVSGAAFVYPALSAVLLAPLALVSSGVADHIFTLLCIALVPATLWVTGVRDWRVYGVTLLWYPIIIGWQGENISVPLMFMTALAWRHRERPLVAGLIVAAAISMKPFLWPLGLWLLATRRWKAAVYTLAWGALLNLLAWATVGFNQISTYVHMSSEDARALWRGGYSILAVAHHLGLGRGAGEIALGLAVLALTALILYRGLRAPDDRQLLVLAVALMLLASPLVWIHYFVLLAVPLAISRPRLSVLWVVPVAMWLLPPATRVNDWQLGLAWALVAGCLLGVLRDAPVGRRSADRRPQAELPLSLATTG